VSTPGAVVRRTRASGRRAPAARRSARRLRPWARWRGRFRLAIALFALAGLLVVGNWLYHVVRKPSELVGLVAGPTPRAPRETWQAYGALFRAYSTDVMTQSLLAALVQAESRGDATARTYWRWRWSGNPLEWYGPASSAVGILQITDGTFAEARRYCIHDHRVARAGAWTDLRACWFNSLYSRLIPSHAIEMTSARLHQAVEDTLVARGLRRVGLRERQDLAAVIHLCGAERGAAFARHGFRPLPDERCGDHGLREYLRQVRAYQAEFARLEAAP
jgi:hypothetical protein